MPRCCGAIFCGTCIPHHAAVRGSYERATLRDSWGWSGDGARSAICLNEFVDLRQLIADLRRAFLFQRLVEMMWYGMVVYADSVERGLTQCKPTS